MRSQDLIDSALKKPLSADEFKPKDLHIDRRAGLTVTWADGHESHYSLDYLRKSCPCATCRNELSRPKTSLAKSNADSGPLSLNVLPTGIDRATEFANAKVVGNYAIQIEWGDGHRNGIYDFRYLRMICPSSEKDRGGE